MEITTRPSRKVALELGLSNERVKKLDNAEMASLAAPAPRGGLNAPVAKGQSPIDAAFPDEPLTAAEAERRQKARKAKEAAEEAERKKPKPGLLERAKKLIGVD
jgi:hypothetical protein